MVVPYEYMAIPLDLCFDLLCFDYLLVVMCFTCYILAVSMLEWMQMSVE